MTKALAKKLRIARNNLAYWRGRTDLLKMRGTHYHDAVSRAEEIVRELEREVEQSKNPASALRANWQPAMIRRLRNGRVQIKIRPAATARRRARSRGRSKR